MASRFHFEGVGNVIVEFSYLRETKKSIFRGKAPKSNRVKRTIPLRDKDGEVVINPLTKSSILMEYEARFVDCTIYQELETSSIVGKDGKKRRDLKVIARGSAYEKEVHTFRKDSMRAEALRAALKGYSEILGIDSPEKARLFVCMALHNTREAKKKNLRALQKTVQTMDSLNKHDSESNPVLQKAVV